MKFKDMLLLALALLTALLSVTLYNVHENKRIREEARRISPEAIRAEIEAIGELAVAEYRYRDVAVFEASKVLGGVSLPFTEKSFILVYSGIIKAGTDLESARVEVDADTVRVRLAPSAILSHALDEKRTEILYEEDGLFNRIRLQEYTDLLMEEKAAQELAAMSGGLLREADEKARNLIKGLLGPLAEGRRIRVDFY